VIELPDLATFAALFADRRIYAAIAVSIIAGATRGFSGFGSALIYVPLISAIYDPRTAAVTFLLIDAATGIAVLPTVWREANWREVLPLAAAAVFAGQFGALILQYTDPVTLRWGMVVVVLTVLGVLVSGWHYHGKPLLIVTLGVGLIAGLLGAGAALRQRLHRFGDVFERLFGRLDAEFDRLVGAMKIEHSEPGEPRRNQGIGRIGGEPRARDTVLDDIERVHHDC